MVNLNIKRRKDFRGKILTAEDVETIKHRRLVKKESLNTIRKDYGFTAVESFSKYLKDIGLKYLTKQINIYKKDTTFFEKIDTEEKAYILGFIYADGSVRTETGYLNINLNERDVDILYKFKEILKSEAPIRNIPAKLLYNKKRGYFMNQKPQCYLRVMSKKITADLLKCGIMTNKSFKIIFPPEDIVPRWLRQHFIRGYFDGDGSASFSNKNKASVSIISNENFCIELRNVITNCLDIHTYISSDSRTPIKDIRIGGNHNVLKFLNWIYKDATIFLQRKHNIYQRIKEHRIQKDLRKTSKFFNVTRRKNGTYRVVIAFQNKNHEGGTFKCEKEAAKVADLKILEFYGYTKEGLKRLNFGIENYI